MPWFIFLIRLMLRTLTWNAVVALIHRGADADQVAAATLDAAEKALSAAA
jgi:hypothetical protein